MTDSPISALEYLIPAAEGYWKWQDGDEVVAWSDGRTIAFRHELQRVLARLARHGLPPLPAVLLLLAATRDNWRGAREEPFQWMSSGAVPPEAAEVYGLFEGTLEGLNKVQALESGLRNSIEAKEALAELVFEAWFEMPTQRSCSVDAQAVLAQLQEGLSEEDLAEWAVREQDRSWDWEFVRLAKALKRVDPDVLAMRIATGLDDVVIPAEIASPPPTRAGRDHDDDLDALDLSPSERVRRLIEELERDEQFRGLARLARDLMAVVTLPQTISPQKALPLGGVSDITNRGPLDRLLLSELANDDLVLAVRIAMNEALYLKREASPANPAQERAVLLDTGIRSWGIPRVFATAVGLALAATTDRHTEVTAYRTRGDSVEPVDLGTRAGLVEHLGCLETALHPGAAFAAFEAVLPEASGATNPVLVTTEDALADPEFQQVLASGTRLPLHVATVNRDGRFRLIRRTSRGSKIIRESQLDLDQLFTSTSGPTISLVDPRWAIEFPAILRVQPFPLLLPHVINPQKMWLADGHGIVAVSKDRRLMLWRSPDHGAQQLADNLPRGDLWWMSSEPGSDFTQAIVGRQGVDHELVLVNADLSQARCEMHRLPRREVLSKFSSRDGVLFAVEQRDDAPDHVRVLNTRNGDAIESFDIPEFTRWERGRFYRNMGNLGLDQSWSALSYDGRAVHLDTVYDEGEPGCPELLTLFDRQGVDGPIGITCDGDVYLTATGILRKVAHRLVGELAVAAVSSIGDRVILLGCPSDDPNRLAYIVIDVDSLAVDRWPEETGFHDQTALRLGDTRSYLNDAVRVRHRFRRISTNRAGGLVLVSRRQRWSLAVDRGEMRLRPPRTPEEDPHGALLKFEWVERPRDIRFHLGVATWPDGSQAFLDSRGLLHLKSSETDIPETTIVLTLQTPTEQMISERGSRLSGWCSDGRLWGERFFIGDHDAAPDREIFESAIKAFTRQLS